MGNKFMKGKYANKFATGNDTARISRKILLAVTSDILGKNAGVLYTGNSNTVDNYYGGGSRSRNYNHLPVMENYPQNLRKGKA
ncbi:MAG: hypothetical protein PHI16_06610 [Methanocellales archaeon]|nr:hypothetical protein [Methanocellales archaeon]